MVCPFFAIIHSFEHIPRKLFGPICIIKTFVLLWRHERNLHPAPRAFASGAGHRSKSPNRKSKIKNRRVVPRKQPRLFLVLSSGAENVSKCKLDPTCHLLRRSPWHRPPPFVPGASRSGRETRPAGAIRPSRRCETAGQVWSGWSVLLQGSFRERVKLSDFYSLFPSFQDAVK